MTTVTELITTGTDDGYGVSPSYQELTASASYCGWIGTAYQAGWRFQTVDVPQGTVVTSATLKIYAAGSNAGSPNWDFYGSDTDTIATWSTSNYIFNITKTTATTNFSFTGGGGTLNNINVKDIVDEIFARGSWVSGNDLAICSFDAVGTGTNYGLWAALENTTYAEPALEIVYTPAGGGTILPMMNHHGLHIGANI